MINYTMILPNMKAIKRTTSEELHSQSEAGQTNERKKNQKTICPYTMVRVV